MSTTRRTLSTLTALAAAGLLTTTTGGAGLASESAGPGGGDPQSPPWEQVGPGWTVAAVDEYGTDTEPRDLVLVSPDGEAFTVGALEPYEQIIDVATDGSSVLTSHTTRTGPDGTREIRVYDLVDGTVSALETPLGPSPVRFLSGEGGLVVTHDYSDGRVEVVDTAAEGDGVVRTLNTPARGEVSGWILTSNDGERAVFDRGGKVRVLDATTAKTTRTFENPEGYSDCKASRWWNESEVAAACASDSLRASDVFAFDVETGDVRRLTRATADTGGWTHAWWSSSGVVGQHGVTEGGAPLQWVSTREDIGGDHAWGRTVVAGIAYSLVLPDPTGGQFLQVTDLATGENTTLLDDVVGSVTIDARG